MDTTNEDGGSRPERWFPTHQSVADRLGLTVATISRIRSGTRLPSLDVMNKIKDWLDWSMDAQTKARNEGTYHVVFNARLRKQATAVASGR